MTLDMRLMVNNRPVGALTVRRLAPDVDPTDPDVQCLYLVTRRDDITGTKECQVRHRYGDGAWRLAATALLALAEADDRATR